MTVLSSNVRQRIADHAIKMFEQAFKDWAEMFGFVALASTAQVRVLEYSEAVLKRIVGLGILVSTRAEGMASSADGDIAGSIMFVFPNDFIGSAITTAMMIPPTDSPEANPENQQHVETTQELMNLFCGSATSAMSKTKKRLRVSQSVEDLHVSFADAGIGEPLDRAKLVCVSLLVKTGERTGKAWCIVPDALVTAF